MSGRAGRLAACLPLAMAAPVQAIPPRPAPPVYATHNYALTFRPPLGATYCPLPPGWIGSDHGTTVFIERPRDCGGAGYPSSSRGFSPGNVARLNLFYAYDTGDPAAPQPCRPAGATRFLGQVRRICRVDERDMVFLRVEAPYRADIAAVATLTLGTRPSRMARDLSVFRRVAAGVRTCTATFPDRRGRPYRFGSGRPCARSGWF